ncbi:MAG: LytTR family transcriptional regulator DNA-binding domain-containing protein [Bacteroidales bacterium]|nr:LytTR family transcriptional regulator DNA-binding domain-containing protein [Bacteroidales bacterium]
MRQPDFFLLAVAFILIVIVLLVVISGMCVVLADRNRKIRRLTAAGAVSWKPAPDRAEGWLSFLDTGGTVRLTVFLSNLYYIESDDNYIKVWYADGSGALRSQMVRCRLKTVEERFRGSPLVRCSRKRIVNAERVKALSKEGDGYFIDMGNGDIPPIDVTKSYRANVLDRFGLK